MVNICKCFLCTWNFCVCCSYLMQYSVLSTRSNLLVIFSNITYSFWVICLFCQLMRKGIIKISDYNCESVFFAFLFLHFCFNIWLQYWKFFSHYLVKYFFCTHKIDKSSAQPLSLPAASTTSLGYHFLLEVGPVTLYSFVNSSNIQQNFKYILSRFSSSYQKRIVKIT